MAKQSRKIIRNIHHDDPETESKNRKKPGRDILLLVVIAFTFGVLFFGWASFNIYYRAMYSLLVVSLSLTYKHRHGSFKESINKWFDRISLVSIAAAVAIFCGIVVMNFCG